MSRYMILLLLLALLYSSSGIGQIAGNEQKFPVSELKEDLQFYKYKLEINHPGLYLYSSKRFVDSLFKDLDDSLTHSLSGLEFYRHIAVLSSAIMDGHTLILPASGSTQFHDRNSRFLPYQISMSGNGLYVRTVQTGNHSINPGARILSINGVDASDVLYQVLKRQVRDGHNPAYPAWILDNYFREFFSYVFGHPEQFEIVYTEGSGEERAVIPALSKDSILHYKQLNNPPQEKAAPKAIELSFGGSKSYAVLTIRDFHNAVLRKTYHQHFKKEICACMREVLKRKPGSLVIDLRNNQGGDIANGIYLLSYLLKDTFRVVEGYNSVQHGALRPCKGAAEGLHKSQKEHFEGRLYVLINGGSFSNTSIVCACLKKYERAVFIGTETGGSADILCGYVKTFELPHTHIRVDIPRKQFVLSLQKERMGRGIQPDYLIAPGIEDMVNNRDAILDAAIMLAGKAMQE